MLGYFQHLLNAFKLAFPSQASAALFSNLCIINHQNVWVGVPWAGWTVHSSSTKSRKRPHTHTCVFQFWIEAHPRKVSTAITRFYKPLGKPCITIADFTESRSESLRADNTRAAPDCEAQSAVVVEVYTARFVCESWRAWNSTMWIWESLMQQEFFSSSSSLRFRAMCVDCIALILESETSGWGLLINLDPVSQA